MKTMASGRRNLLAAAACALATISAIACGLPLLLVAVPGAVVPVIAIALLTVQARRLR